MTFTGATFVDVDLVRGSAFSSLGHSSLNGIENVRATNGQDFVLGDACANRIEGLGGDDRIDGGEGDDVLIGGSGADTFVFEAIDLQPFGMPGYDSGDDVISDFGPATGSISRATSRRRPSPTSRPGRASSATTPSCGSAKTRSGSRTFRSRNSRSRCSCSEIGLQPPPSTGGGTRS